MTVESLLSGAAGVLLGVIVGPIVAAAIQKRIQHRDSLHAVLGEIRGNMTLLRVHRIATEGEREIDHFPIPLSASFEVCKAMSAHMSAWGEGTIRHVMLFYAWLRHMQELVDAHRRAVSDPTAVGDGMEAVNTIKLVRENLYRGATGSRDQALEYGDAAITHIIDELRRIDEFEPNARFDHEAAKGASEDDPILPPRH